MNNHHYCMIGQKQNDASEKMMKVKKTAMPMPWNGCKKKKVNPTSSQMHEIRPRFHI